jgi:hypothetical protein
LALARLALAETWTLDKLVSIFTSRDSEDPVTSALTHATALANQSYASLLAIKVAWPTGGRRRGDRGDNPA